MNWTSTHATQLPSGCDNVPTRSVSQASKLSTEPHNSDRETLDDEADRLWLARMISAPDVWRSRATNAAGLLSAAAAASVASLVVGEDSTSSAVDAFLKVAAVSYVIAVMFFLAASILGSPQEGDHVSFQLVDDISNYCKKESAPIKLLVRLGAGAAAVAIIATGSSVFYASRADTRLTQASVAFVDSAAYDGIRKVCPNIPQVIEATVEPGAESRLRLHLEPGLCDDTLSEIDVRREDVVLVLQ